MYNLKEKIDKNWALLLNQRSENYLIRSRIDQNIAIANSNLAASFMGNRQLANHNTVDIKYSLNKIAENNLDGNNLETENIETVFLKHQQKLNRRLFENSMGLIDALEQLQIAHKRVMKTNEEIIKFNANLIDTTSEVIQTNKLPQNMQLNEESIDYELIKIQTRTKTTNNNIRGLSAKLDEISRKNDAMSLELNEKRQKIKENRDKITGIRGDLSLWTD